jgi:hypothetical protein
MLPENYIDTIVLMANRLMQNDSALAKDKAIEKAIQNYFEGIMELGHKLATVKKELGDENWQLFIEKLANKPTTEDLQANYNSLLANKELLDGVTNTELELSVEYEGASLQRIFPAGTKIKLSKTIWENGHNYVEVWTAPNSVDYTLRQNVLVF